MSNIYIKIRNWDPDSKSIIFSCASDSTRSSNPDDYPYVAIQPFTMWPNFISKDDFLKKLAELARIQCEVRAIEEKQVDNLDLVNELITLEGQSFSFDVDDIINEASNNLETTQVV